MILPFQGLKDEQGMDVAKEIQKSYLHQNLRFLRKRLNLSQEELAGKVGLNRGNIASYENGTAEPRICNLLKLSSLFGISIMDITQKDLSNGRTLERANQAYQDWSSAEEAVFERFRQKSEEIKKVVEGLHACHQYKTKSFDTISKDMQVVLIHFEQLYDATQSLLCNHQTLLEYLDQFPEKTE